MLGLTVLLTSVTDMHIGLPHKQIYISL